MKGPGRLAARVAAALTRVKAPTAGVCRYAADTHHSRSVTERRRALSRHSRPLPTVTSPIPHAPTPPESPHAEHRHPERRPARHRRAPAARCRDAAHAGRGERHQPAREPAHRRHAEAAPRQARAAAPRGAHRRRDLPGRRALRPPVHPELGLLQGREPGGGRARAGGRPQVPRRLARLRRHRARPVRLRRRRDGHRRGLDRPLRRAGGCLHRRAGLDDGAARGDEPRDRARSRLADVGVHAAGRRPRGRLPALLGRVARPPRHAHRPDHAAHDACRDRQLPRHDAGNGEPRAVQAGARQADPLR